MTTLERLKQALANENLELDIHPTSHEYLNTHKDPDSIIKFLLTQARLHKEWDELVKRKKANVSQ